MDVVGRVRLGDERGDLVEVDDVDDALRSRNRMLGVDVYDRARSTQAQFTT